jgi:hypothetical protein
LPLRVCRWLLAILELGQLQVPNLAKNHVRLEIQEGDIAFEQHATARLISDYGSKYDAPLVPRTHTSDKTWSWSFLVPVCRDSDLHRSARASGTGFAASLLIGLLPITDSIADCADGCRPWSTRACRLVEWDRFQVER